MTNYPPNTPDWAAKVWSVGEWIYLDLPAVGGRTQHTVRMPNTSKGLMVALQVIRDRNEQSKLGTDGDLTRHQVDKLVYDEKMVKRAKKKDAFAPSMRIGAREILRKMGMIS